MTGLRIRAMMPATASGQRTPEKNPSSRERTIAMSTIRAMMARKATRPLAKAISFRWPGEKKGESGSLIECEDSLKSKDGSSRKAPGGMGDGRWWTSRKDAKAQRSKERTFEVLSLRLWVLSFAQAKRARAQSVGPPFRLFPSSATKPQFPADPGEGFDGLGQVFA